MIIVFVKFQIYYNNRGTILTTNLQGIIKGVQCGKTVERVGGMGKSGGRHEEKWRGHGENVDNGRISHLVYNLIITCIHYIELNRILTNIKYTVK